ncbi:MAG TPA: Y-family DNA polymerase [Paludibacter sp.]|nr:Y-family DNA polymerase [Paludibacter sp.]HOS45218.1 Y-family DNA polymerase [Paludibacter sp.]HPM09022.1 Y-family DNA polymerase [Paludibacter sp.]
MFAHIDCNNFYASCERVFNPALNGKPVVVLSNNDGCAIARSSEAKALGIPMGAPAFKYKEIIEKNHVHVFSANFPLYGDMSNRVMSILGTFSPVQEVYSIDECFLDLSGFDFDLKAYGLKMKERVFKWTGLPISIGIAPTKALCKIATRIAKKYLKQTGGVHVIDSENLRIKALKWLEIGDVWGIGRQYTKRLLAKNIKNAYQFTCMNDDWVKTHMSIVGLRLKYDLQGIPSIMMEDIKDKKNIATTRTFDYNTEKYEDIKERIVTFATKCAEKLRKQGSCCNSIQVFIATNFYREDLPQYSNSICIKLPFATNSTFELAEYAVMGLEQIFKKGYAYKRAGVLVMDFTPESNQQLNLFQNRNTKHIPIMNAMDKLNRKYGHDLLRLGAQAPGRTWRMKQEKLSPHYTTNINEVLSVKV